MEFALILPLLIGVLACVIDYGWFFFQQTMAVHAVGEAARTGAMMELGPEATRTAAGVAAQHMAAAGVDCSARSPICEAVPVYTDSGGMRVMRVDLDATFVSLTGFVPVPGTLHARSSAVLEDQSGGGAAADCPPNHPGCSGIPDRSRTGERAEHNLHLP